MQIVPFFDAATWTLTYLVYDEATKDAVVIDPVLDYDPLRIDTAETSVEHVAAKVKELGLNVHYIIDTHAHADHLSGMAALAKKIGARTAIGRPITVVQEAFTALFNLDDVATDGSQFDVLLDDNGSLKAGSLTIESMHTPGHTPACFTYKIGDAIFTGDTLFMPDFGTGRCDFPGGSASDLYDSIQRLYALPGETRVFVGHDYQPGGRPLAFETTIDACRNENIQLKADTSKDEFVTWRAARDATLSPPKLIMQSLQVNIRAGELPPPDSNDRRYLRMPMGVFPAKEA